PRPFRRGEDHEDPKGDGDGGEGRPIGGSRPIARREATTGGLTRVWRANSPPPKIAAPGVISRSSDRRDGEVDRSRAHQPEESREAVGVYRARGDDAQRDRLEEVGGAGQQEGEGEDEQRLDRLLEGPLRQVGSGEVR